MSISAQVNQGEDMKHKVEYLFPGSFFSETAVRDLDDCSVKEAIEKAPERAFCFTIYDVEDTLDLGPDFQVSAKPKNRSGKHYLGGQVYTVEDIEMLPGDHDILVANMRSNKLQHVIKCRTGNFQPFDDGDVLVVPRA